MLDDETSSLLGRVEGVNIGDIIELTAHDPRIRVSGYLHTINYNQITLSQSNPHASNIANNPYKGYQTSNYDLSLFAKIALLKRRFEPKK